MHYLDRKSEFLNGNLKEDIYVIQLEGYNKHGDELKVYNFKNALYGLRQAPRAWNTKVCQGMIKVDEHGT